MRILANDYEANLPGSKRAGTGGPANFSKQLASALGDAGHAYIGVTFLNREIKRPMINKVASHGNASYLRLRVPNSEYRSITEATKPVNPQKKLSGLVDAIRDLLKKERPDIVFINGFDVRVWALMSAAHKEGIPVVQQHAGIWSKELDAYQHLFSKGALQTMKSMEKSIPRYATKQIFLNTYCEKVFDREIAPTPKKQRAVIPLPTAFKQQAMKSKKKDSLINVGIVARWDRIKNHEAVLALAEEIERQGLNMKVHAITKVAKTKKFLAFKKRYKTLIDIHPPTDAKGVLTFFRSMDIAILPSHFETAGFVVLEAASQGIGTIISKHVGWINDYLETGNREWVGDFTKPKTIVKKITNLAGKPLSNALLKRFHDVHEPKKVFEKYLNLFQSLAS